MRDNDKDSASTSSTLPSSSSSSINSGHPALSNLTASETAVINDKLSTLFAKLKDVKKERENSDKNLKIISKTHEKIQNDAKPYFKHKLKKEYKNSLKDCETESKALEKVLDMINDIRNTVRTRPRKTGLKETSIRRGALMKMLQSMARTMPLFIPRKRHETAPPLTGCIPADSSYMAKTGDMVAALIKPPTGDVKPPGDESNWILGEVVRFNHSINKFEIDDIDEEQKEKHVLSRRRVVVLPQMRADPEINHEAIFEPSSNVLALYPQTTCFYRGIIGKSPENAHDDYLVLFEDQTYPEGYSPPLPVPQRFVIRDIKKK